MKAAYTVALVAVSDPPLQLTPLPNALEAKERRSREDNFENGSGITKRWLRSKDHAL